jgi:hypothetical protein
MWFRIWIYLIAMMKGSIRQLKVRSLFVRKR